MSSWWLFFSRYKTKIWWSLYVITISFFLAKTVNLLLANWLLPIELNPVENLGSPQAPSIQTKADLSRILSRNIFDSNATQRRISPQEPEMDPNDLRPSTLNAELVGTVVFENSKYSVALIRSRSDNTTKYYSLGDRILGASVMRIERFRIIIQNEGRLETLELQAAKSNMPTNVSSAPSRPAPSDAPGGFEEIGPGRYLIPEKTVSELMSNLPQIMRDARAVPNIGPDNRINGFKMLEIRPNSIFSKLGLQNGDVVRRVNEDDLNSVEKGMSLFTALRNEKTISIDIDRSGSRLNYTYEIR